MTSKLYPSDLHEDMLDFAFEHEEDYYHGFWSERGLAASHYSSQYLSKLSSTRVSTPDAMGIE